MYATCPIGGPTRKTTFCNSSAYTPLKFYKDLPSEHNLS